MSASRHELNINGRTITYEGSPMSRLLDVVRQHSGLTGSKDGCSEGECGACTVLLDGDPVCSCLVPVVQAVGRKVVTVEAVAGDDLDAIQRAFVDDGGVQCGACTPGIVITVRALLDREPEADRDAVREAIAGNLCRCTGYERIFRAVERVVREGGGK